MREIKFRGKHINNKKWVYGYYAFIEDRDCILLNSHNEKNNEWSSYYIFAVDPKTLGQYTGLNDNTQWDELTEEERENWTKQGNLPSEWTGKEIYEDDIVTIYECEGIDGMPIYSDEPTTYIVEYAEQTGFIPFCEWYYENPKIIGNRFDNPELMPKE